MITQLQRDRLTRNVQNYIRKLEADIAYWKDQAMQATGKAPSPIVLDIGTEFRPLPERSTITFNLQTSEVSVRLDQGRDSQPAVHVYSSVDTLIINPCAANAVYVSSTRR